MIAATVTTAPTPEQLKRLARDWSHFAGSDVYITYIKGVYYGSCQDELAALRIERKYNRRPEVEAFYSKGLKTWMVRLDPHRK